MLASDLLPRAIVLLPTETPIRVWCLAAGSTLTFPPDMCYNRSSLFSWGDLSNNKGLKGLLIYLCFTTFKNQLLTNPTDVLRARVTFLQDSTLIILRILST